MLLPTPTPDNDASEPDTWEFISLSFVSLYMLIIYELHRMCLYVSSIPGFMAVSFVPCYNKYSALKNYNWWDVAH